MNSKEIDNFFEKERNIVGVCKMCKEEKKLTKHSLYGYHKPPYVLVCRKCHDLIHNPDLVQKLSWRKRNEI